MWLHAWLTARNAEMIAAIAARRAETSAHEPVVPEDRSIESATGIADHPATPSVRPAPCPVARHAEYSSFATTTAAGASKPVELTPPTRTGESPATRPAEFAEQPTSHPRAGAAARADADAVTTVAVDSYGEIAEQLVLRKLAKKPVPQIVTILRLAAQDHTAHRIAAEMSRATATPWARSTVDRIITRAESLGFDPTNAAKEVAA
jgi:hypothetical protein